MPQKVLGGLALQSTEQETALNLDYDSRVCRKEIEESRVCVESMVIMAKLFFKLY
jgi:hypothetical protein